MGARQTVGGRSSCVLYLGVLGALALAVALAVIVFIVAPERERRQQAELQRAQATVTAEARMTEVQRTYDAGAAFAEAGDWDKAAEEFARVVALEPGYKDAAARLTEARASAVESAYQRGLRLLSLEQWEQAKAEFEQVIALNPNYKDVQANLAKAEARLAAARALTPTVASASRPTERLQPTAKVVATSTTRALAANWKEAARSAVVDYFESWKDKDYDAMFSLISNAMEYKIGSAEELRQIYSNTRTALHFYSIGQGKFADDMTSGVFPVGFDIESASFPTMRATRNINVSKSGAAWVMDYWGLWKVVRPAESQSLRQSPDSGGSEGAYSIAIDRVLLWTDFTVVATTETWRPIDPNSKTRWYQGVKSAQLKDNFGNNYTFQSAKSSPPSKSYENALKETGDSKFGWLYFDGSPPTDALYLRLFLIPQDSTRQITFERLELQ